MRCVRLRRYWEWAARRRHCSYLISAVEARRPDGAMMMAAVPTFLVDPRVGNVRRQCKTIATCATRVAPTLERKTMFVITRNGKTTILTGWRAWLAGAAVWAAATLLFFFIAFVVLGFAITVGTVLLIVVPVAIGFAILASLFRPNSR